MQPITTYIKHPEVFLSMLITHLGFLFPDKLYLQLLFRLKMGFWLDLKHPTTFSEKIQWLKLYDRNPEYTTLVDKIAVKEYVSRILGDKYIIPTLGKWNNFEEIDFDLLPEQFVLKTNNGGGNNGVVICKDKKMFDKEKARRKLSKSLKQNIYKTHREWPYKNINSKIFAETFLEDSEQSPQADLKDYKWFCFNGEPKYCQVIQNRNTKETIDFFDTSWNHQDFIGLSGRATASDRLLPQPKCLDEQIAIAQKLSQGLTFCRIDLYEINKNVYFGEITFYPASGFGKFRPDEYNNIIGAMLKLPNNK